MSLKAIGKSPHRSGGLERVMGTHRFVGDIELPGMLHAKLVTIDAGHARITSIDKTEALQVEDVTTIVSGQDLPRPLKRFGPAVKDRPLLAAEEVHYHGEPVAIVVAETPHAATAAAAKVKVEYQELPAVTTVEQAQAPDAPLVQDPAIRPNDPFKNTNTVIEHTYGWGNVDNAEAELIIENTYNFPMMTQFAMEPFTYLVEPDGEGFVVYSAIQNPNFLQKLMADLFELPISKVRVVAPDPGGGFGGKQQAKYEPILAYLSLKLRRPVRLELTLAESFQTVRRSGAEVNVRSGFTKDGLAVFHDFDANYLLGAYVDIGARVVTKGAYVAAGPYKTPNVRITARGLLSNTVPSSAMRGFGCVQVIWPMEAQMDAAARQLGIDRVEIRRCNMPKKGEKFMPNDPPADGDWFEVLRRAAEAIGWNRPRSDGRALGIALGMKCGPTNGASYSSVRLHMDGSATISAGTSDMGQGARTVYSQIATEELGVPLEKITVNMGDTTAVPFDLQTTASRSTVFMGTAIVNACKEVNRQLCEFIAEQEGVPLRQVSAAGGVVSTPSRDWSIEDVLKEMFGSLRGEIIGVGQSRAEKVKDHPLGGPPAFYEVVCNAVELEVDEESGQVAIHKMVNVADVGKALNPQHVAMQDEGGVVQGIGHSLMEQYILDEKGRITNLGAMDYRVPTARDIPDELVSLIVENEDGPGPYGAKGMGEGGLLATSPAIASAIAEAVDFPMYDLPLTAERIWRAIQERQQPGQASS